MNNLITDKTTDPYPNYPPQLIRVSSGASLSGLVVYNNFLQKIPLGNVSGSYSNNYSGDPKITKSGARPDPYYMPQAGSPLIDKGMDVGFPYSGSAPDIGAFEYSSKTTSPPPTSSLKARLLHRITIPFSPQVKRSNCRPTPLTLTARSPRWNSSPAPPNSVKIRAHRIHTTGTMRPRALIN